ncbi:hypothetical protein [Kribbella sp. NPDC051620]|uniref:hypothetical protein n=1 Tax=Kribbella sp. NPDC051620 TaxID=3364120 RepID=UPI0037B6A427
MKPAPIRPEAIQNWLGGDAVVVGIGRRVPLTGGATAPVIERVSVIYEATPSSPDEPSLSRAVRRTRLGADEGARSRDGGGMRDRAVVEVDVVAKRATVGEVGALRCLGVVDPVFPELIDSGIDEGGPWIVVPFEVGGAIGWMAEPPAVVYAALARLHLRHLGRVDELPAEIPKVDEQFLRSAFTGFAPAGIARAAVRRGQHAVFDRALEMLARFAEDERLLLGLEVLPPTLIHGDVYGDNVIAAVPKQQTAAPKQPTVAPKQSTVDRKRSTAVPGRSVADCKGSGSPRLIDWGSARVGPGMLDVVMAGRRAGVAAYKDAWRKEAGTPMGEWLAATGEAWATAVSNATFVGAAAERSVDLAELMVEEAEEALERLGQLLSRRP